MSPWHRDRYLEEVADVPAVFLHIVVHLTAGDRRPLLMHQDLLDDEPHPAEATVIARVAPLRVLVDFVDAVDQADLENTNNIIP